MKRLLSCILILSGIATASTMVTQTAVNSRALALANNYVALVNDATAFYYNPAAMAFSPVREIGVSMDWHGLGQRAEFFGTTMDAMNQWIRFSSLALLRSFPTSQGGFAVNLGFVSPYNFHDVNVFKGTYLQQGDTNYVNKDYTASGQLNQWGGGFGLQVAPGFGLGASVFLVTGTENIHVEMIGASNTIPVADKCYSSDVIRRYLGYDVRLGMLYSIKDVVRIGIRLGIPQNIYFNETAQSTYPFLYGDTIQEEIDDGKLTSSLTASAGIAIPLPIFTLSSDLRVRAPYTNARRTSEAANWKIGAGAGLEVPVAATGFVARAGYSYDEFDPYNFLFAYSHSPTEDILVTAEQNRQQISGGISYLAGQRVSIDGAYAYSFWNFLTNGTLKQKYIDHRVAISFSFRY